MRNMCERLVLCVHLCGHQSHQPGIFYKCLSCLRYSHCHFLCYSVFFVANILCDFQAFFSYFYFTKRRLNRTQKKHCCWIVNDSAVSLERIAVVEKKNQKKKIYTLEIPSQTLSTNKFRKRKTPK